MPGVPPVPPKRFVVENGPELAPNAVLGVAGAALTVPEGTDPLLYGFTIGLAELVDGAAGIMGFEPAGADGAP